MYWEEAADIKKQLTEILAKLPMNHVNIDRLICFRSFGSSSRAQARIWSLPRVWQQALKTPSHYIIEVLSEKFDRLSLDDKNRVLIHELMHIPKNFSGSLLPHRGRGRHISNHEVEKLFALYCGSSQKNLSTIVHQKIKQIKDLTFKF